MIKYLCIDPKKVNSTTQEILDKAWQSDWIFSWIVNWEFVFYKKETTKSTPRAEVLRAKEQLFYNRWVIFGLCKYAFDEDFEILYKEWRDERKLNPQAKIFSERSERLLFGKFNKVSKPIAVQMLKNAIEMKYLSVYDLTESEKTKILEPLRIEKAKQEEKMKGFQDEQLKKEAEQKEAEIEKILKEHPEIKEEATNEVEISMPNLKGVFKEQTIKAKMRIIAKIKYGK